MPKTRRHPAIWFLFFIAIAAIVTAIGALLIQSNESKLLEFALVPDHNFNEEEKAPPPDYTQAQSWAALPTNLASAASLPENTNTGPLIKDIDIFFIHPTTALKKDRWSASIDDKDAAKRLDYFPMRQQASAFTAAGQLYAPRYRQASLGAFFDKSGNGAQAIFMAYGDVLQAFDHYMAHYNQGRPFILAGHSQGALHGLLLLKDRIAASETVRAQLVAAYLIGWPIGFLSDLAPLGFLPCTQATETGCVVSYQTFGKKGDAKALKASFAALPGVTGLPHTQDSMVCVNPLDWQAGANLQDPETPQGNKGNLGSLELARAEEDLKPLIPHLTGAYCGEDGVLYLDRDLPSIWYELAFAGENLHPYDINLFWLNIRQNALARSASYLQTHAEKNHKGDQ